MRIPKSRTHIQEKAKKFRYTSSLVSIPLLLSIIGVFFVFEASSIWSLKYLGDSFHFLKLQIIWIFMGILLMGFFSVINYKKLYHLSLPMMIGTIILLVIVLIPRIGHEAGGAVSWIDLGFFHLQPTELAKLATILYLASWFKYTDQKRFFAFLLLLGIVMLLIMFQPDMGTAVIIFSLSVILYFLAGKDLHYLLLIIPASAVAVFVLVKTSPYRFRRITAFLDPSQDPLGASYHINQNLISLSNGGLFGQGFGASRQKYLFLPEAHTDSIFAIIGEEFGFIGSFVLISLFVMLLYVLYVAYIQTEDRFGKLLVGGTMSFFALQIIINLGGMVNLLPLTGVTLPFLSYGGSHMIISFILLGIVINVTRQMHLNPEIAEIAPTPVKKHKPRRRRKITHSSDET
jgi:cell division protein FtsW